jgi:dTDP-4-dehydrorhamnose reductase
LFHPITPAASNPVVTLRPADRPARTSRYGFVARPNAHPRLRLHRHHEKSVRNDVTIYGQSKKIGERVSRNVLGLRCSIIGEQLNFNQHHLLQWLKSQPRNSSIQGYENYFWNGITTKAFARIVSGIVSHESKIFGKYHLTPADFVSKFELLTLLAHKYDRDDIQIKKTRLLRTVDRTLNTNYPKQNLWFWEAGGYVSLQSIKELVNEL